MNKRSHQRLVGISVHVHEVSLSLRNAGTNPISIKKLQVDRKRKTAHHRDSKTLFTRKKVDSTVAFCKLEPLAEILFGTKKSINNGLLQGYIKLSQGVPTYSQVEKEPNDKRTA